MRAADWHACATRAGLFESTYAGGIMIDMEEASPANLAAEQTSTAT